MATVDYRAGSTATGSMGGSGGSGGKRPDRGTPRREHEESASGSDVEYFEFEGFSDDEYAEDNQFVAKDPDERVSHLPFRFSALAKQLPIVARR